MKSMEEVMIEGNREEKNIVKKRKTRGGVESKEWEMKNRGNRSNNRK